MKSNQVISAKSLSVLPRLSEKGFNLSHNGVYIVELATSLNKNDVKRAIESQFDVNVVKVNILKAKGKSKRTITKKGRRVAYGRDVDIKKAYITLAKGNSLPFFEAIEEEEKKAEEVQAKVAKEIEKQDKPKHRSIIKKAEKE
jgi:large subunit ribosomal protein L23